MKFLKGYEGALIQMTNIFLIFQSEFLSPPCILISTSRACPYLKLNIMDEQ